MKKLILGGLLTCLLLVLASPALAGWEILYQGGGMGPSAAYIQDNKLRQDMGSLTTIFDIKTQTISYVNTAKQVYWTGTPQDMMTQATTGVDEKLAEMMKSMPPALRKQMKAAMGQQKKQPKIKFSMKKTGKTIEVAGYKCAGYELSAQGRKVIELWVAPIKVADELDIDRMSQMMGKMALQGGQNPMNSPEMVEVFKSGYPLKQVVFMGSQSMATEAKSVTKKSLPASTFEVPANYKKVPSFMKVMHQ